MTGCYLLAVNVRCWLPSARLVWRKEVSTLRILDPHKDEKMAATWLHQQKLSLIYHSAEAYEVAHRRTNTITFISGNYIIYKSRQVQCPQKENSEFSIIYQPDMRYGK